ncbi:uncharacterized protein BYT42DRAFT_579299 [Radiomyces spectabilis]|uniref:uncharacterized protein n=1 Tax=Radiomyces spectabilis TaxID=64574 RepID=UPI0022203A04|nr:uncharacterized protein BYT42DRAFT_579299 [Radiomyces spectabilis]KAI8373135.1 hypothetical protein BYT42DRAFT_579299 [Radiomyces spectabilis]
MISASSTSSVSSYKEEDVLKGRLRYSKLGGNELAPYIDLQDFNHARSTPPNRRNSVAPQPNPTHVLPAVARRQWEEQERERLMIQEAQDAVDKAMARRQKIQALREQARQRKQHPLTTIATEFKTVENTGDDHHDTATDLVQMEPNVSSPSGQDNSEVEQVVDVPYIQPPSPAFTVDERHYSRDSGFQPTLPQESIPFSSSNTLMRTPSHRSTLTQHQTPVTSVHMQSERPGLSTAVDPQPILHYTRHDRHDRRADQPSAQSCCIIS